MKNLKLITLFIFIICFCKNSFTQDHYQAARELMVKTQIKNRGIKDKQVIQAMLNVERHKFVPENLASQAYDDHPLSIGYGQTISQPYIVALMTQLLNLSTDSKVLEIGTGSGYQAAVLAEICDSVFTIEIVERLAVQAKKQLNELGYDNINLKIGDGYKGWKRFAPFDAIIVTCAPTHIPEPLKDQLAEGGRMIIPIGKMSNQRLVLVKKKKDKFIIEEIVPVAFVPMMGKEGQQYIKY